MMKKKNLEKIKKENKEQELNKHYYIFDLFNKTIL